MRKKKARIERVKGKLVKARAVRKKKCKQERSFVLDPFWREGELELLKPEKRSQTSTTTGKRKKVADILWDPRSPANTRSKLKKKPAKGDALARGSEFFPKHGRNESYFEWRRSSFAEDGTHIFAER